MFESSGPLCLQRDSQVKFPWKLSENFLCLSLQLGNARLAGRSVVGKFKGHHGGNLFVRDVLIKFLAHCLLQ